ncbi:MAG: hypothetical protein ACFE8N_13950 [Promethearchaeota archaeon]
MPIHIIPDNYENLIEGAYLPGEILRGEIIVKTKKRIKARKLSAIYVGMEHSSVTRGGGKNSHTYYEKYYHFNIEDVFMEPKPGANSIILDGSYRFNYEFEIPENAPPSFKLHNSGIQYLIDVKIDRAMASDIHKKLELLVIPNSLEKIEQGPLTDLMRADSYIPECTLTCKKEIFNEGDTVDIELNVLVNREPKINDIRISIESISTISARGYTDTFPSIIKGWKISKKNLKMGENLFNLSYEIPMNIPYSILGMLVKRNYFIHLKLNRRFYPDNHLWLPIIIVPSIIE